MASNATPGTVPTLHNYTTYYNTGILDILCNICSNVNTSYMGGTMLSVMLAVKTNVNIIRYLFKNNQWLMKLL